MTNPLLYAANIINYVRIIFFIIFFTNIKYNPLIAILTNILSGLVDEFDGSIARSLSQTSKYGQFIDIAIDRMTSITMNCFLACLYAKYWMCFCVYIIVELLGDIVNFLYKYNSTILSLIDQINREQNQETRLIDIKNNLYDYVNIKIAENQTEQQIQQVASFSNQFNIHGYLNPIIWYMSDLFFLFMYFGGVCIIKYQQNYQQISRVSSSSTLTTSNKPQQEQHEHKSDATKLEINHHIDMNNNFVINKSSQFGYNSSEYELFLHSTYLYPHLHNITTMHDKDGLVRKILREFKNLFLLVQFVFGEFGLFVEKYLNSRLFYMFNIKVKKLKVLFRFLSLICFIGTVVKFTRNFSSLLYGVYDIVELDIKLNGIK